MSRRIIGLSLFSESAFVCCFFPSQIQTDSSATIKTTTGGSIYLNVDVVSYLVGLNL
jgi:hypothetical protein